MGMGQEEPLPFAECIQARDRNSPLFGLKRRLRTLSLEKQHFSLVDRIP